MKLSDIQKFIDEDINPALDMHGGSLSIESFDEESKNLKVRLGGGCQGCASAKVTLQLQVNSYLREEFPDLNEIEDITDHSAGETPYYA
jgi:Fe/S biogenesis protein NfuA